jgi:putative nucleotidyltransferase with HDIG domain
MAKSESKPGKHERSWFGAELRPDRAVLGLGIVASFLIAVLLRVDLFAAAPAGIPSAGEYASRSFKAPFDITFVDQEATDRHRDAAGEQAKAVYDYDERAGTDLRLRVHEAFSAAREALDPEPAEGAIAADPTLKFLEVLTAPEEFADDAVAVFAAAEFSLELENSMVRLLEPLASRMIATDLEEFQPYFDQNRVFVRELGSGAEAPLLPDAVVLSGDAARAVTVEQASSVLADLSRAQRRALLVAAKALVRPNLSFNLRATDESKQAALESVQDVTISLTKGQIIVREGDKVSDRHELVLRGIQDRVKTRNLAESLLSVWALVLLLFWAVWRFGSTGLPRFPSEFKDANFLLLTTVVMALGTKLTLFICDAVVNSPDFVNFLGQEPVQLYYVVPFAAATMLVRMVHNAETAALFAVLSSLLVALQLGGDVSFAFYTLVGSLVAAIGSARVSQRGTLLRAGTSVGIANMAMIFALEMLAGNVVVAPLLIELAAGFVGGCLAGGLVIALAPLVESVFQYTTDIRLLELANREQELLRDLEIRAPGTYHHSMMVGHLAEKAAEVIGANALLAKVAGYYHDIGKMRRPHFFVENITIHRGENRHEKLSPSMSARIIQAHVKDGLDLGRQHQLAPPIMRGIGEHHGTSIIRFFYEKAKENLDPEKGEQVQEHEYRYPGPKPQTREAGILMLADSVEAASRTLADTSPARVQQLVQRITNNYFRDGQLDECSLTLRDLHAIARSFIETLSAIRHERIDYPAPSAGERRKSEEGPDEGVVERIEPKQKDRQDGAEEDRDDDLKRLGLH